MDRILKGIMKYRDVGLKTMVKQFQEVRDNPMVSFTAYKLSQKQLFRSKQRDRSLFIVSVKGNVHLPAVHVK